MKFDDKTLKSDIVFNGYLMDVEVKELENEHGLKYKREIVRRRHASAVVAINDGNIVLVKQFRAPVDMPLLELPAGIIENNNPEETAYNELIEEAGYKASKMELMTRYYSTAGFCDEEIYIYKASGLEAVDPEPEEEELIEIVEIPLGQALDYIKSGKIIDAKTMIGILMTQRTMNHEL